MIVEVAEIDSADREAAGEILMNSVVGSCKAFFEIRRAPDGVVSYWVYASEVSREVYHDCLVTAHYDVYQPEFLGRASG